MKGIGLFRNESIRKTFYVGTTMKYQPKLVMSKNKYGQQKFKPLEIVKYN